MLTGRHAGQNESMACFLLTIPSRNQPICWLSWKIGASYTGDAIRHHTGTLRSAGSSNFFGDSPSLRLIERNILRAKYQKAARQMRKMIKASKGLNCRRVSPPSTAASSPRLSPMFVTGSGDVLLASRVAAFAVCVMRLVPPASNATMTVNAGLG